MFPDCVHPAKFPLSNPPFCTRDWPTFHVTTDSATERPWVTPVVWLLNHTVPWYVPAGRLPAGAAKLTVTAKAGASCVRIPFVADTASHAEVLLSDQVSVPAHAFVSENVSAIVLNGPPSGPLAANPVT